MSRLIERMLVTSLMTSTPRLPRRRSRPPCASFDLSRFGVAESNVPSEAIVLVMIAPAPARLQTVSVFAFPLPEMSSSHNGSPLSRSAAAVANTTLIASRSYPSPSHSRKVRCKVPSAVLVGWDAGARLLTAVAASGHRVDRTEILNSKTR